MKKTLFMALVASTLAAALVGCGNSPNRTALGHVDLRLTDAPGVLSLLDPDGSAPLASLISVGSATLPYPTVAQGYVETVWATYGYGNTAADAGHVVQGDTIRVKGFPFWGGVRVGFTQGNVGAGHDLTIRCVWS